MNWVDSVKHQIDAATWVDFIAPLAMVALTGIGVWISLTAPRKGNLRWLFVCGVMILGTGAVVTSIWQSTRAKVELERINSQAAIDKQKDHEAADRRNADLKARVSDLLSAIDALGRADSAPRQSEQIDQLRSAAGLLSAQLEWKFTPHQADELRTGLVSIGTTGIISVGSLDKTESLQRSQDIRAVFSAAGWQAVLGGGGEDLATDGIVCVIPLSNRAGAAAGRLLSKFPDFKIVWVEQSRLATDADTECTVYNRPGHLAASVEK